MGSSDCFCAICGGCIRAFETGSSSEKAKRLRREILRNGHERRAQKNPPKYAKGIESESDDGSDINDASRHSYAIEHAYDPEALEGHDTSWITDLVLIASVPEKEDFPRIFFCGLARYDDVGLCDSSPGKPQLFENDWEHDKLELYNSYYGRDATFPSHLHCLQILARAITGSLDVGQLEPYVLHEAMTYIGIGYDRLKLDYGDIPDADQFWESYPGYEFSVVDPLEEFPMHDAITNDFVLSDKRKLQDSQPRKTIHIQQDPFCKLPPELILHTTTYMEGLDILALRKASLSFRNTTSDSKFWKSLLQREQKWLWDSIFDPQFWESSERPQSQSVDWKKLYTLLEKSTGYSYGLKGEMMALANRRRIWKVCERIGEVYDNVLQQGEELKEADRVAGPRGRRERRW